MPVHVKRIFFELQYYALTFDFWTKNFYKGDTLLIFQAVTSQSFKVERINISSDPSRPKQQTFHIFTNFISWQTCEKSNNIKSWNIDRVIQVEHKQSRKCENKLYHNKYCYFRIAPMVRVQLS